MIQDIAWSPRLVGTTTATAASAADVTAGTSTSTFITPAALAGSSPTFGGNLTVSGGTIGTAASTNLTLAGGSSGASLLLGQGTNGSATLTTTGTGVFNFQNAIPELRLVNSNTAVANGLYYYSGGTLDGSITVVPATAKMTFSIGRSVGWGGDMDFVIDTVSVGTVTPSGWSLAGNLTVSGGTITGGTTGLSLASGGTNQSITLTPSGTGRSNAYGSIPSSAWAANDLDSSFNAGLVVGPRGTGSSFGVSTSSASSAYPSGLLVDGSYAAPNSTVNIKAVGVYSGGGYGASLAFHTSSNTTLSEVGRFTKAGNFLIKSDGIDGGQKLQVGGDATFAGNVTVGNSAVDSGYTLRFTKAVSGTFPRTDKIVFGSQEVTDGSAAILGVQTAATGATGYLEFKTTTSSGGSTTALTLDSSQNATFAGAVTVSGADKVLTVTSSAATPGFTMRQTGGIAANRNWGIVINNSANGDFILRRSTTTSGDPTTAVLTFDSTGNATFAGSIAIGNTVNTVSPTSPNRTITMVIGGTTYYLHAKTTND